MESLRSCLSCNCLGDRIFGQDVDRVFTYQTPRVVKIHDRTLGLTKLLLMLAIFSYIFVFQIWYKGEHFELAPVEGISRLQWQQPTKEWCNPHDIECFSNFSSTDKLPYCTAYKGKHLTAVVRDCDFYDGIELPVTLPGGVLMPTYITTYKQARSCPHGSRRCKRKYYYLDGDGKRQRGEGQAVPASAHFVADVGHFTVLIDHSIRVRGHAAAYDDFRMRGYYEECNKARDKCETQPIQCVHDNCPRTSAWSASKPDEGATLFAAISRRMSRTSAGRLRRVVAQTSLNVGERSNGTAPSTTEQAAYEAHKAGVEVKSIAEGDVLSLSTLMHMAGIDLDDTWEADEGNMSYRLRGAAIVVDINYYNLKRWTLMYPQDPPSYTISVTSRPVNKFKHSYVSSSDERGRTLKTDYGVYVIVQQTGVLAVFNPVHVLTMLAAAGSLLAISNTLTDMIAVYALPEKQKYSTLKYMDSGDFKGENNAQPKSMS